jgi:hypothetical protein
MKPGRVLAQCVAESDTDFSERPLRTHAPFSGSETHVSTQGNRSPTSALLCSPCPASA